MYIDMHEHNYILFFAEFNRIFQDCLLSKRHIDFNLVSALYIRVIYVMILRTDNICITIYVVSDNPGD